MNKQLTTKQALRYSRQILLKGFDLDKQEILLNSSVLQIGAGGLGCANAQYLIAAGVGHITLVDDDTVELTNLQRQVLHREKSIGQSKVESASASLKEINSEASIKTINQRLDNNQLVDAVAQHDVVVDCSDNLTTRNQINRACIELGKPLVSGAAIRMEGQVSSFFPSESGPCYRCLSQSFGEQNLTCVESGVMSPVVGIIGATQALETIKVLTGYGQAAFGKLMVFDATSGDWTRFTLEKSPNCPDCGHL